VADVGVGVRAAAVALDLAFIPLVWQQCDIVLRADALDAAEPLVTALRDPGVRHSITELGGYDTQHAGEIKTLPDPRRAEALDTKGWGIVRPLSGGDHPPTARRRGPRAGLDTNGTQTVRLLSPLAQDLAELRMVRGHPDGDELLFQRADGKPWTRDDWRNWRNLASSPR
jgi:hypothetical protein